MDLPGLSGKESVCQCRRHGFDPWFEKIPWRRKWQPTLVSLTEKFYGQKNLVGYSPWGHRRAGHDLVTPNLMNSKFSDSKQQYIHAHTYTRITESLCYILLKLTLYCKSTVLQLKNKIKKQSLDVVKSVEEGKSWNWRGRGKPLMVHEIRGDRTVDSKGFCAT